MKKCPKCNIEKEFSEFRPNSKRKDGMQAYCIPCDKKFQAEWYLKNKSKYIAKSRIRNDKNRFSLKEYIVNYLKSHPCIDCGEKDIVVLEFDHIRDKSDTVANILIKGLSLERLKEEIEKCEVRCANCHKRKTAKDFNWYKNLKQDNIPNIGSGISLQN